MCAFDRKRDDGTACHFTVYESNSCYLGSLTGESSLLTSAPTTSADLQLKDGKMTFTVLWRDVLKQFC